MDPLVFDWIVLPGLILLARIGETSLKTLRQVYVSKGLKYLASGIGTGEIAVWLLSTGLVITNLANIPCILAYIAGYGLGTLIGIELEDRIKVGTVIVRIITRTDPAPMIAKIHDCGYGITRLQGSGSQADAVFVLFTIVPRAELEKLLDLLKREYPDVLFTIEDIRSMKENTRIYYGERPQGIVSRMLQMIKP